MGHAQPPLGPPPPATTPAVSRAMRGNVRAGTTPEVTLRRLLRESGFRGYRLNWAKAPGSPDVAYPGRKVALFVHGCFWHRCPHCDPPLPKANRDFWERKFARNQERDRRKQAELEAAGWRVLVIWECEPRERPGTVMARVTALLSGRTAPGDSSDMSCGGPRSRSSRGRPSGPSGPRPVT